MKNEKQNRSILKQMWALFFFSIACVVAVLSVIGVGIYQAFMFPEGAIISFVAFFYLAM